MYYDYKCAMGHEQEASFPIGKALDEIPCNVPGCAHVAKKQFTTQINCNLNWLGHDVRAYRQAHPLEIDEKAE